jgi:hypothetical protein
MGNARWKATSETFGDGLDQGNMIANELFIGLRKGLGISCQTRAHFEITSQSGVKAFAYHAKPVPITGDAKFSVFMKNYSKTEFWAMGQSLPFWVGSDIDSECRKCHKKLK